MPPLQWASSTLPPSGQPSWSNSQPLTGEPLSVQRSSCQLAVARQLAAGRARSRQLTAHPLGVYLCLPACACLPCSQVPPGILLCEVLGGSPADDSLLLYRGTQQQHHSTGTHSSTADWTGTAAARHSCPTCTATSSASAQSAVKAPVHSPLSRFAGMCHALLCSCWVWHWWQSKAAWAKPLP